MPSTKRKQTPTEPSDAVLPPCAAPDLRTNPQFVVPLRRPILLLSLGDIVALANLGIDVTPLPVPTLSCVQPKRIIGSIALDERFEQKWELDHVSIGDLSSTIGLAPREQLTLEFQTSQRKLMDRSVVDSADVEVLEARRLTHRRWDHLAKAICSPLGEHATQEVHRHDPTRRAEASSPHPAETRGSFIP